MRSRNNLVADQQSVWFPFEEFQKRPSGDSLLEVEGIYSTTFPRDISLHIMPIGGRSRARKGFKVSLEPHDEEFEQVVASALADQHQDYAYELARKVCDFFHHCAARIIEQGKAVYEIVLLSDSDTGESKCFELVPIDVRTLESRHGKTFQIVPTEWAARHDLPTTIPLQDDRLIIFSPPSSFSSLNEINEALARLGGAGISRMYSTTRDDPTSFYDAREHIRAEKLALAAATRTIGWTGGETLSEIFLEYYTLHRRLIFERFVISLREAILQTLNEVLGRVGPRFGKSARLQISGLPTLDDVAKAVDELAAGERTFNSVLDDFTLL
jgi:hypothetical protein